MSDNDWYDLILSMKKRGLMKGNKLTKKGKKRSYVDDAKDREYEKIVQQAQKESIMGFKNMDLINEVRKLSGISGDVDHYVLCEVSGLVKKSYFDYQREMQASFLNDVKKGIKKVAGSHAEKLYVNSDSFVFLSYQGQDRSDMDLDITIYVIDESYSNVRLVFEGKGVARGKVKFDKTFKLGVLTPQIVVDLFREYFE